MTRGERAGRGIPRDNGTGPGPEGRLLESCLGPCKRKVGAREHVEGVSGTRQGGGGVTRGALVSWGCGNLSKTRAGVEVKAQSGRKIGGSFRGAFDHAPNPKHDLQFRGVALAKMPLYHNWLAPIPRAQRRRRSVVSPRQGVWIVIHPPSRAAAPTRCTEHGAFHTTWDTSCSLHRRMLRFFGRH